MGKNDCYDVSVIIVSYNPKWEKLRKTICSVIQQRDIRIQLVICDDGSDYDYYTECMEYLEEMGFGDYKFIKSKYNTGTVSNLLRGVRAADGIFIRSISPGDYLYGQDSLIKWVQFCNIKNCKISFGNGVYYNDDDSFQLIRHKKVPYSLALYKKEKYTLARKLWLELDDMALGAAFLTEKNILLSYLTKIEGKIRLGEDFSYTLMQFNYERIIHYDSNVVWYEYGHGVSTGHNKQLSNLMWEDWVSLHRILLELEPHSLFDHKLKWLFKNFFKMNYRLWRIVKYIVFPDMLIWKLYYGMRAEYTETCVDTEFILTL